jgi:hypothetical protein
MMRGSILVFLAVGLHAEQAPSGIVRGQLVKWTGSAGDGQLILSNPSGEYSCTFDTKTYMERDGQMVAIKSFSPGDRIELVTDRKQGSDLCYARTLHAVEQPVVRKIPGHRPPLQTGPSPTESWAPRGDMTFSGVVVRLLPEMLILRTRSEPRRTIQLRNDTRYISDGVRADSADLKVNTHVFVRCGRNLDDEIEAYQVIWGGIVHPE